MSKYNYMYSNKTSVETVSQPSQASEENKTVMTVVPQVSLKFSFPTFI